MTTTAHLIMFGGLVVLGLLALTTGMVQARAEADAWRRIAAQRRELGDERRRLERDRRGLWAWQAELIEAADGGSCPACRLRQGRDEPDAA